MEQIQKDFIEIKNNKNPEEINDFLIKLSKNPNKEYFSFLDYFINNLDPQIFEKIKLNIIFNLGEIGKITPIEQKYLEFIINSYSNSDRWIRNEIIQAFDKISIYSKLPNNVIKLILNALNDEYPPIKKNALKIIVNFKKLSNFRNIYHILNSKDSELVQNGLKILRKFLSSSTQMFDSLNFGENYKILKKKAIQALLIIFSNSLIDLESFRELILNTSWENKETFLKEIEVYERILLMKI